MESIPKCDLCNKNFNQRKDLLKHNRNFHDEENRKLSFKCPADKCLQKFSKMHLLQSHISLYHGIMIETERFTFNEIKGE